MADGGSSLKRSVVRPKYMPFRGWCLRGEVEARGGGDLVTSLTTSNEEIAPQSPPARRVAGDAPPSVSRALLSDVTASPASRPLTSDGAAHATKGHVFRTHYTSVLLAACRGFRPFSTCRDPPGRFARRRRSISSRSRSRFAVVHFRPATA